MTRALYRRLPWPVINPVLIPTAVIIGLLLWLDLPLDQYQQGRLPSTALLEPAVVALALPLYQQARQNPGQAQAHRPLHPHLGAHLGLHHLGALAT